MADPTDPAADRRPHADTIAGTGPGIPDDALAPDQEALPDPPGDAEVARVAEALGAPVPDADG